MAIFGRLGLGAGLVLVAGLVLGLTVLAGSAADSSTSAALASLASGSQACEVTGECAESVGRPGR